MRRQDPVECLFSFICSSNNNIARITLMLDKLRTTYGKPLLSVGKGGLAGMGIFKSEVSRATSALCLGNTRHVLRHTVSRTCVRDCDVTL